MTNQQKRTHAYTFMNGNQASQTNRSISMPRTQSASFAALLVSGALCLALSGCGMNAGSSTASPAGLTTSPLQMNGRVMGGQQPIGGSTIQLYAVGSTGYGSAYSYTTGTSLLGTHAVSTDANGNWGITGDYTCPSASTEVYIAATGGTSSSGGTANPNIALIAALGPCGNLSANSFITINELTTVAAVWPLAPFMTGIANVGAPSTNLVGLTNAFTTASKLVNVANGQVANGFGSGVTIPTAEIDTLADILATCINTNGGGTANDGTPCGQLFKYALSPSGVPPTDTVAAALYIAQSPGQLVSSLNGLVSAQAPFQPTLATSPTDFTIALRHTAAGSHSAPSSIASDTAGNIWITSGSAAKVTEIDSTGAVLSGAGYGVGLTSSAIAMDLSGNAIVAGKTSGTLIKIAPGGSASSIVGGGLGTTNSIAVDGNGNIWATGNSNILSEFTSSGTPVSSTGYTGAGTASPESMAITSH